MLALLAAVLLAPTPYRWRSVPIVGAGFVDGVVFHPKAKGIRYARTDIGGAYRWEKGRWEPMLDWVPYDDLNWMGVESVAVDPNDPQKVFLACGTYTSPGVPDGAILRSSDGGRTFQAARVPIKFGGNEDGRGNGERLGVDPFDGAHLLLATRKAGLWESRDGAATWRHLNPTAFADGAETSMVLFDPANKGSVVLATRALQGAKLFRSSDGGGAWAPLDSGSAFDGLMPTHLAFGDGALWVTLGDRPGPSRMTKGAVWKHDGGAWTDVTPEKGAFGYAGVSSVRGATIVSSFYRPGGEQVFRTLDGGKSWVGCIGGKETYDYSKAPYIARTGIHWLFDIEIDPFDKDHAVFTTGYGGHETFDLTNADRGKPVHWSAFATGIEESVALAFATPTKGAPLVTAIGDYGGFLHRDFDRPAPEGSFSTPHFGNTTDVAVAENEPGTMVRVGRSSGGGREANLGFSLDGGRSWRPPFSTPPNAREGSVAVSPDGATWVWSLRGGSYRTDDYGFVWTPCDGLPAGLRVVADPTGPRRFYALDLFGERLYESADGARSFAPRDLGFSAQRGDRGDSRGGQDRLYPTPGRAGDLWIAAYDGLYHASPTRPFVRQDGPTEIHAFGFGKAAKGRKDPALYLVGVVGGQRGIFRSDDAAVNWTRINDDAHQWGLVLGIAGDRQKYGRVYVGTHGRGTLVGEPQ